MPCYRAFKLGVVSLLFLFTSYLLLRRSVALDQPFSKMTVPGAVIDTARFRFYAKQGGERRAKRGVIIEAQGKG